MDLELWMIRSLLISYSIEAISSFVILSTILFFIKAMIVK